MLLRQLAKNSGICCPPWMHLRRGELKENAGNKEGHAINESANPQRKATTRMIRIVWDTDKIESCNDDAKNILFYD